MPAVQRLQGLSGQEFDRAYIAEMVQDHTRAVELFERASQQLDDQELKQFASQTLATLKTHKQHAEQLSRTVGQNVQP
jgi:putative membrane protein